MNSAKHRTGFGLHDLRHQVARRFQWELELTENPPQPRSLVPGPVNLDLPEIEWPLPAPTEKRPLAA
ncbi:MAG: hypothetical protein JSS11_05925 [Verrucomicrobia bacterium]|nr:hypothetical protein [Verrucomicrobiota bacterium]